MRGFIAFLMLLLVGINLINFWHIEQLQAQVATLQTQMAKTESRDRKASSIVDQALPLLEQAQDAIQKADFVKAKRLLSETSANVDHMARTMGDKTAPGVAWLRQQVQSLESKMDNKKQPSP